MTMWIWIFVSALILLAVIEEVIYYVLNKQLGLERESQLKKFNIRFHKLKNMFKKQKEQSSQSA
ncbi:hypothetical protein [Bacillus sp. SG-1]|uniref:hypothetical protein n=1 Tax=Bacillus sp. SG-1 TaxID=161544 RepID=UPI0001544DEE|nr:hypothetical protein [Bacillus sp. SG-1]EDL64399.1 hypothetical protein BSG1_21605 [Bacillus sp. SG-1]